MNEEDATPNRFVDTNSSDLDQFSTPAVPDFSNVTTLSRDEYAQIVDHNTQAAQTESQRNEDRIRAETMAIVKAQALKEKTINDIDEKLRLHDQMLVKIGDLRELTGSSVDQKHVLKVAANATDSPLVKVAIETGDINLLMGDPQITNETILYVISELAEQELNRRTS